MDFYRNVLRPLIFATPIEPEWWHRCAIALLATLENEYPSGVNHWLRSRLEVTDDRLSQTLWGIEFPNPVGLAAGFDKDGEAAGIWGDLGFGFAELGTATWHPQPGNPRPRLFRLPRDRAVLNRMGFNNNGARQMAAHLDGRSPSIPIGINIGKSKITPLVDAPADYLDSFRTLAGVGDYFVVNVSSPNTPGLRSLQAPAQLEPIFDTLQRENTRHTPILVKIAPDLAIDDVASVVDLARNYELAGVIATNTTISRAGLQTKILPRTGKPIAEEAGGISGVPLRSPSTEMIRFIWQHTNGEFPIVGVGGIFSAEDAWEKITAGASLVQLYTGWIYEGPFVVSRILAGLLQKMAESGCDRLSDAVGLAHSK